MCKVACYIDGFNLYHGIDDLNKPHLKWVNLYGLAGSFLYAKERLVGVNYFSAYATWLRYQYPRHQAYVAALEYVGVSCVMAHFKTKQRACRNCGSTWIDHEEKETDVRLALKVLEDACDGVFDRAILISGDSDLVPVVQTIRRKFPEKKILIVVPPGRYSSSRDLRRSAHHSIEITKGRIGKCLLPHELKDGAGNLIAARPVEYAPP